MPPRRAWVGVEVHAALAVVSKLLCPCPAGVDAPPNTLTCPVCAGFPGALPSLNGRAAQLGWRAALALGATPARRSSFSRKHYRWPDLPKGYQVTQTDRPLATGGAVHAVLEGETLRLPLRELHLEEDAGRLHPHPEGVRIDLNRAGVALLELVSEPTQLSPEALEALLRALHRALVAAGVTHGRLERGELRLDLNVSLADADHGGPGPKVEIKNLGSFRFVRLAYEEEIRRQQALLDAGEPVEPHTRAFDGRRSRPLRDAGSKGYLVLAEPDLPPLVASAAALAEAQGRLDAAPLDLFLLREDARAAERLSRLGLTPAEVTFLRGQPLAERLFWEALAAGGAPDLSLRWLRDEAWRHLKQSGRGGLTGEALVDLAQSVTLGERTRAQARAALQALITGETPTPHEPEAIDLSTLVQTVFNEAPELHARLNAGETRLEAHFIGQVMRRGQGAWSPAEVLNTIRATAKRS
ncbi:MAG: hypothetical protein IPI35_14525 [Deltaproteobacteria bacterium]|nr:hypothetical protein [Deltaproteobacteria bacterium]